MSEKKALSIEDLCGKELMMIQRGWNKYLDALRDGLQQHYPDIHIRDFDLFRPDLCGVKPEMIDYLVMSHPHYDHSGKIECFKNAKVVVQKQANLGHATAAFTLDVYGHVSEQMKDTSAARMQAYINGIQGA